MTIYAFGLEDHLYSGSGTNQGNTYYYSLGGRLIGSNDANGTVFYMTDTLGSILASFTNTAGGATLKGNQVYGPYGNERYSAGTINTAKGFTGQYNDALTGLDYYNARYYDPVAGVFLSADVKQGDMQGVNPYAYVNGNPATDTDPTGRYMVGLDGSHAYSTSDGNGGVTLTTWIPSATGTWWETIYHYNAQGVLDSVPRTPNNSDTDTNQTTGGVLQQILDRIHTFLSNLWQNLTGPASPDEASNPLDLPCGSLSLSFAPSTKVATSQGEKEIGSLHSGERVWAYNTKTHKMELEPVVHVWINHDNDLVDVTIVSTIPASHSKVAQKTSEVVHTNMKHPFLTVEKGFIPVSQLRVGMHVINASGGIGTIAALKAVPGSMTMYNLEVAQDHTFTVGRGEWIVHNCGVPVGSNDDPTSNITMQDILNNPYLLKNMTPEQVANIARQEGWIVGTLGRGTHAGQGLTLRQLNAKGTGYTDNYVQWHPGGGQHGPDPYWKVSSGKGGTVKFASQFQNSSNGDDATDGDTDGIDIPDPIDP